MAKEKIELNREKAISAIDKYVFSIKEHSKRILSLQKNEDSYKRGWLEELSFYDFVTDFDKVVSYAKENFKDDKKYFESCEKEATEIFNAFMEESSKLSEKFFKQLEEA